MYLEGKYGKAFLTIDNVEPECISQIYSFLNHPAFTNYVAMQPDMHSGAGAAIGLSMLMTAKIIPNVIGVDIACGILTEKIKELRLENINWKTIDEIIRRSVPIGFNIHAKPVATIKNDYPWEEASQHARTFLNKFDEMFGTSSSDDFDGFDYASYLALCTLEDIKPAQVDSSIGTLGGGNHFIEIGNDLNNDKWLTIHCGSRNFGLKVATWWQKKAQTFIENKTNNKDLAYLSYPYNVSYLLDMIFVSYFARLNRKTIADSIGSALGITYTDSIESVHNYIDSSDMIIRKGAIRSYIGERMIIPFNMRDGMLLCEGKSNSDWNNSAPHGAGRVMSRTQAKKCIKVDTFKEQMDGIFSTCVGTGTLDEAPDSYKSAAMIENAIGPTATIINRVKPLYNLKG